MEERNKVGFFDFFRKKDGSFSRVQMLNNRSFSLSQYLGTGLEKPDIFGALDYSCKHMAKLRPIVTKCGEPVSTGYSLLKKPNPYCGMYDLLYTTAFNYLMGNAMIYIRRDDYGYPVEMYPLPSSECDVLELDGKLYIKFKFQNKTAVASYYDIIHLRNAFFEKEFWGENTSRIAREIAQEEDYISQGIQGAISQGANLRGILQFSGSKPKKLMDDYVRDVTKDSLKITNSGGFFAIDGTVNYIPLANGTYVPNKPVIDLITDKTSSVWHTSQKLIRGEASEEENNNFYETVVEPFAIRLTEQFSDKLPTYTDKLNKYEIVFSGNALQYANTSTKLGFVQLVDRGAMTVNEWRSLFNWGPIEGGDKPIRRLDTAPVKESEEE